MKRGLKIVAVIGIAAIMAGCSAKEGNDQIEHGMEGAEAGSRRAAQDFVCGKQPYVL